MTRFHFLSVGFRLFLIPVLLAFTLGFATPAASQPMYTYANGVQLAAMATLPFYHISTMAVSESTTLAVTRNFSGITGGFTPQMDAIKGYNRFSIFNDANHTVLEQYGATSGFYAYNPDQAFSNSEGGNPPAANFTIGTPTVSHTSAGNPLIHVPVHNTGGRAIDVLGSLRLTGGPNSLQAGPFPAVSTDTLAPGQSHPDTFMLSLAIPDGPWQATFTLTSGLITRTETVTLNLGGGPAGAARTAFPVLPVAAGVTAAILLAIAVLLILRARRTPPPGTADAPG